MLKRGDRIVIAGVSVRALALSAARAGYRVAAVDAFGDRDLRAAADVFPLRRDSATPYTAKAAAQLATAARVGNAHGAAYTANFENHPDAVAQLALGRQLLGNAPEILARVRSPAMLMRALARLGFAVPKTRMTAPAPPAQQGWLCKPRRSGGGRGTQIWRRGAAVGRGAYVQERIAGVPGSIAFVADGRHAVPLGLSRQLVGESAFGACGFGYCGSVLGDSRVPIFDREDQVRAIAAALAEAVTAEFGLVGVNGIDFIARDGIPYPIEVNPRYSASMELIERAHGVSIFELHARACAGQLPHRHAWLDSSGGTYGKAVVFARWNGMIGDTAVWLDSQHADVPHPGEPTQRGQPICTVFARGRDQTACHDALVRQASAVYDRLPRVSRSVRGIRRLRPEGLA